MTFAIAMLPLERSPRLILAITASLLVLAFSEAAVAQQVVKIGYAPFATPLNWLPGATPENYRTLDPNTGQGAMIELHKAIAKDVGFQIQFVSLVSGELPKALRSGTVDLRVVDASTEDRATTALTATVYNDSEVLIANRTDTAEYKTWTDLRGQVIGSRTGAIYEDELKKAGFEIRSYAAVLDLYNAVNDGVVKVAINTTVVATAYTLLQGAVSQHQDRDDLSGKIPTTVGHRRPEGE
jgi:ABC-type amino acid transport substrate-binding protein